MIGLLYVEKLDSMLSRFHLIPAHDGQTGDRSVCAGAYEGLGSLWVIAVATYIQRKYKQKQITHDRSKKITQNVNALKVVDRIDLTKFKNART